eukprot:g14001.t1
MNGLMRGLVVPLSAAALEKQHEEFTLLRKEQELAEIETRFAEPLRIFASSTGAFITSTFHSSPGSGSRLKLDVEAVAAGAEVEVDVRSQHQHEDHDEHELHNKTEHVHRCVLWLALASGVGPLLVGCYNPEVSACFFSASMIGFCAGLLHRTHFLQTEYAFLSRHGTGFLGVIVLGLGQLPPAVYVLPVMLALGRAACALGATPQWLRFSVCAALLLPLLGMPNASNEPQEHGAEVDAGIVFAECYPLVPVMTLAAANAREILAGELPPGRYGGLCLLLLLIATSGAGVPAALMGPLKAVGVYCFGVIALPLIYTAVLLDDEKTANHKQAGSKRAALLSWDTFSVPHPAVAFASLPIFLVYAANGGAGSSFLTSWLFIAVWCGAVAPVLGCGVARITETSFTTTAAAGETR